MRKNNRIIVGSLIGSIAVLAGVISYAILNNQINKEMEIEYMCGLNMN